MRRTRPHDICLVVYFFSFFFSLSSLLLTEGTMNFRLELLHCGLIKVRVEYIYTFTLAYPAMKFFFPSTLSPRPRVFPLPPFYKHVRRRKEIYVSEGGVVVKARVPCLRYLSTHADLYFGLSDPKHYWVHTNILFQCSPWKIGCHTSWSHSRPS